MFCCNMVSQINIHFLFTQYTGWKESMTAEVRCVPVDCLRRLASCKLDRIAFCYYRLAEEYFFNLPVFNMDYLFMKS